METITENCMEDREQDLAREKTVCPALILGKKVMCDVFDRLYHPGSRQIREYCTNENHVRCLQQIAV